MTDTRPQRYDLRQVFAVQRERKRREAAATRPYAQARHAPMLRSKRSLRRALLREQLRRIADELEELEKLEELDR